MLERNPKLFRNVEADGRSDAAGGVPRELKGQSRKQLIVHPPRLVERVYEHPLYH
jgi:hypothetical protein